jgi:PAS domain S-box-containing protein
MHQAREQRTGATLPPSAEPGRWFDAFAAFARALSEALTDLPGLYAMIARRTADLFGDAVSVRVLSDDGQRLESVSFHHPDPAVATASLRADALAPRRPDEGLFGRVLATRQPLLILRSQVDAYRELLSPSAAAQLELYPAESVMLVPIQARCRVLGVLLLLRHALPAHEPRDLVLATHVADRIALSIENARLVVAAQRELLERERAEAALRIAQARLHDVIRSAPVVLFALDADGTVAFSEGRGLETLGVASPKGALGHPAAEVFAHAPWLASACARAIEGDEVHVAGEIGGRTFEALFHAAEGDEGAKPGAVGVALDVTERRLAESGERQARELAALERFRLVAENAWDVIYRYRIRPARAFEYVSPSCVRQCGYTAEEIYADPELLLRVVHPDDHPRLFDEMPTPEAPRRLLVLRHVRKDGSVFWAEQHVRGVFDDGGRLVALEGILRDVTERKRAEDELRRAKEAAEALNHEIEAFSYSVSHDLRAPLRHIDGFSAALLEDYAGVLDERGKDFLARVRKGAVRLSELVDALLGLSRLTRAEPVVGAVDLGAIAREILADLAGADAARHVTWTVEPNLVAEADERLARVVLENLLGNAWKFTSRVEEARIEVGARSADGRTTFFVRDNGAGFDPAGASRLFRPVQRLHDEAEFPGTGIGLATVRRIVRRFGGDAWAESRGAGATFYFAFGR